MPDRSRTDARRAPQACARPDLHARLPEWPDLSPDDRGELESHAAACPECGPGLAHLREVEGWLHKRAAPVAGTVCPSAEQLFDYGRGPGARPLPEAERLALRAHVASCPECAGLVDTLAHRPPAPLLFDGSAAALPRANARRRRLRLWLPALAAAATVLASLSLLWVLSSRGGGMGGAARVRFPAEPVLRGEDGGQLLYPRDLVLLGDAGSWSALAFELAPREGATRYSVVLRRSDGGAFDPGVALLELAGPGPLLLSDHPLAEPGHYTWEAWAEVDGLLVPLGERDFEARLDAGLVRELEERASASEPARSESILHLLHEHGYLGDARAWARSLPPSPARDAYLARHPGR